MLAMLAAAVLATSQPAPVIRPQWERQPSADELMDAYPPGAEAKSVEGRAVMVCTVTVYGDMDDCAVVSETPAGWGFGAAALKVSLRLHMSPQLRNGEPEPSQVRIPVRFALPKPSAPAPASPAPTPAPAQLPLPRTATSWSLMIGGVLGLILGAAALGDLIARGRRAPVRLGAVLGGAFGFVGQAWRVAPAALLSLILVNIVGDLASLAPRVEAGALALFDLPLILAANLMATTAACRVGLRDLRPDDPRLRPGRWGLRFGAVEFRLLGANLLGGMVILLGAAVATAFAALVAWGAGLAMDRWADPALAAISRQAIAAVGGDFAALAGVFVAAMVLIGTRLMAMAPHVVFDPELDFGLAWRSSRGAWLTTTLAQFSLWSLSFLLAFVLGFAGILLSRLMPWDSATSQVVVKASADALVTALTLPLGVGVALQIFRRVRRLEPGG